MHEYIRLLYDQMHKKFIFRYEHYLLLLFSIIILQHNFQRAKNLTLPTRISLWK
jgi:hypothetical protein